MTDLLKAAILTISLAGVTSVAHGAAVLSTLATFYDVPNGAWPKWVAADNAHNLYGITSLGGANGKGTFYRFDRQTHSLSTLVHLNSTDLSFSSQKVVSDRAGNIYGVIGDRAFRCDPKSNSISYLANFPAGSRASIGYVDTSGNLYGTSMGAGDNGKGMIFKVPTGSNEHQVLGSFSQAIGGAPVPGLAMDSSGNLYGATYEDDANRYGTLFKWSAATRSLSRTVTFNNTNGAGPRAAPVIDRFGNLFGTTVQGGGGLGVIYKYVTSQNLFSVYFQMPTRSKAAYPLGEVSIDANGTLYATAELGGTADRGVIFKVTPARNFTVIAPFTVNDGLNPMGNLIVEPNGDFLGVTAFTTRDDGSVFHVSGTGFVLPEPASGLCLFAAAVCARSRRSRGRVGK